MSTISASSSDVRGGAGGAAAPSSVNFLEMRT